jgi:hypothetical protein
MAIDKPANRPTVPAVLPLVRAYYNDHAVGGSLHVVLDDGNIDDGCVHGCIGWAEERGDAAGAALARLLLQMTRTQRNKLYRTKHETTGTGSRDRLIVRDGVLAIATPADPDYGPRERLGDLMYSEVRVKLAAAAERLMRGD